MVSGGTTNSGCSTTTGLHRDVPVPGPDARPAPAQAGLGRGTTRAQRAPGGAEDPAARPARRPARTLGSTTGGPDRHRTQPARAVQAVLPRVRVGDPHPGRAPVRAADP